jgi:putative addiction module component (TIGR02574 family)
MTIFRQAGYSLWWDCFLCLAQLSVPFSYFSGSVNLANVSKKKNTLSNMSTISIADILELPVQERIRLVELIWDSVAAQAEAVEISPALKAELETRLAEFEANPEAGYSWDQVKSHLKEGSWRTV